MQSVLEIATPVCRNSCRGAARELWKLRAYAGGRQRRLRVGSAGTHPFSLFERQRITARDRYRSLVDQPYVARRELIFGMHVHVAVDDPEKAIQVVNGLLPARPAAALGLARLARRADGLVEPGRWCSRSSSRSGLAARFRDYADYAAVVGQLERTGCIADYTHIWWDIRLHPRLGTVEIRICDAVTRVEDAVALAAYCQALVKSSPAARLRRADPVLPPHPHDREQVARRPLRPRGAGDGPRDGCAQQAFPSRSLSGRTLKEIAPHARELGSDRELR